MKKTAAKDDKLELLPLIEKLFDAKQTSWKILAAESGGARPVTCKLGEPCSARQIAAFEAKLGGKKIPPSYRDFLLAHNGWSNFDGGAKLLAVEDHDKPWVKKRLREIAEMFEENEGENPFVTWKAIPILLGEEEQNYLLLDPRKVDAKGEMAFVMFDFDDEEERFPNFTAFLRDDMKITAAAAKASR